MPAVAREALDEFGNVAGGNGPPNFQRVGNLASDRTSQPGGRARGLYNAAETYRELDTVAFNGSTWIAIHDDPGPLPGDGWMLGAKGARGRPGERGKDGVHVEAIDVVGYCLVLTLSDGSTLRANLLPAFERFKRESGP